MTPRTLRELRSWKVQELTRDGMFVAGVWRGGTVRERAGGNTLYGRIDLGGVDAEVSAEGLLIEELQAVPIGSRIVVAVAQRLWEGGGQGARIFTTVRRVESVQPVLPSPAVAVASGGRS